MSTTKSVWIVEWRYIDDPPLPWKADEMFHLMSAAMRSADVRRIRAAVNAGGKSKMEFRTIEYHAVEPGSSGGNV